MEGYQHFPLSSAFFYLERDEDAQKKHILFENSEREKDFSREEN